MNEENIEINDQIEVQNLISTKKFIVLSFLTLGLYEAWWIYKAWRFFQQQENTNIAPAVRTIFSIVFLIPLFQKINRNALQRGYTKNYASTLLFIGYLLISLTGLLPFPFLILANFSMFVLVAPFNALNFIKRNSKNVIVVEQDKFSLRQIFLIILGSLFWVLSTYILLHEVNKTGF